MMRWLWNPYCNKNNHELNDNNRSSTSSNHNEDNNDDNNLMSLKKWKCTTALILSANDWGLQHA